MARPSAFTDWVATPNKLGNLGLSPIQWIISCIEFSKGKYQGNGTQRSGIASISSGADGFTEVNRKQRSAINFHRPRHFCVYEYAPGEPRNARRLLGIEE